MDLLEYKSEPLNRHPWELSRKDFVLDAVGSEQVFDHGQHLLDIGAGDAWLASCFAAQYPSSQVTCVDSNYDSQTIEKIVKKLNLSNLYLTPQRPPEKIYDLVTLFDVLEHVEDDHAFLTSIVNENLAPNGYVFITVPAWQFLFTQHDFLLKHFRRYSPKSARNLIESAGLNIVQSGGLFHSLFAVRCIQKLLRFFSPDRKEEAHLGDWNGGRKVTSIVHTCLTAENRFFFKLAQWNLRFPGLSWWALCKK